MRLNVGKIKTELKRIGKSQSQLAREMGISRALLDYRLKSKKITHAQGFADALGFTGIDLIIEEPVNKVNPGVYLLIKDKQVVYVGQSMDPEKRIQQHALSNKRFTLSRIIRCDARDLDRIEREKIFKHCPIHNRLLSKSKTYLYIGNVVPTHNKKINTTCSIINNKLYIDLSKIDIELT